MTLEIGLMLLLILLALVAFALELVPIEVTAMGMLGLLLIAGFVEPDHAIAGLSNKAVVTIGALFVLSRALMKTGVLEFAAFWLSSRVGRYKWVGVTVFLLVTALAAREVRASRPAARTWRRD